MNDYQLTIQEAISSLSVKSAVSVLSAASKGQVSLDRDTQLKLSYIRITSLSVNQIKQLMSSSVLTAYDLPDYSLSQRIEDTAEQFFDSLREIELYRSIIPILESNEETFGLTNIELNGVKVPATISNWLKDYSAANQHDPLYQMKYINSSANSKQLSEEDRKVLMDIIKLYDKAVSMVAMYDAIELPDGQFIPKDYDFSLLFPDMEEDDGSSIPTAAPATEAPIKLENRLASDFKIPIAKDLDLKAMPKRGLVFDENTNIDMKQAAEQKKEAEIQAKLDELKKRKGQ